MTTTRNLHLLFNPKSAALLLLALLLVNPLALAQPELDASVIDPDNIDNEVLEGQVMEAEYLNPKATEDSDASLALKYSVPEGTTFAVALNTELDSQESIVGDRFQVVLKAPLISAAGYTVVPSGSRLTGEIRDVSGARMPRVEAKMKVVFYEAITPDQEIIPIEATVDSEDGYLIGNRRADRLKTLAVNSAVKQAVVLTAGTVAGYGTGAALFVLAKKGKEVMFKPGDEIYLKLLKPIAYHPNPIFRSVSNEPYNFLHVAPETVPVQFPRVIIDSGYGTF